MDRAIRYTTFDAEEADYPRLEYWLSRPPRERIAEVERLRREYIERIGGARHDGGAEGLRESLRLVKRQRR